VRQFEGIRDGENFIYLYGVGARSKGFFFFVFCERTKASTFNVEERHASDGLIHLFFFNARASAISFFMVDTFFNLGGGAAGESQTEKAVFYSKGA